MSQSRDPRGLGCIAFAFAVAFAWATIPEIENQLVVILILVAVMALGGWIFGGGSGDSTGETDG